MAKEIKSISDLVPDDHNANAGTQRGVGMLHHSLSTLGAGRSIVCDRNGKVIGGNKTLERAYELGFEIEPVRTQGDKLVVVIREDLDLDTDPRARELAYADNRTAEVSLDWNIDVLLEDLNNQDLNWLWSESDLESLLSTRWNSDGDEKAKEGKESEQKTGYFDQYPKAVVLDRAGEELWQQVRDRYGLKNPTKIVVKLMEEVLG